MVKPAPEIVLLGVTAEIDKREDDEANFVAPDNCGPKPAVQAKRQGTENSESELAATTRFPTAELTESGVGAGAGPAAVRQCHGESAPLNSCSRARRRRPLVVLG